MRFSEVRTALADSLATVPDLNMVYSSEPDNVSVPCAVIRPGAPFADYQQRLGRSPATLWRLEIVLLVNRVAEAAAHELLDDLLASDGPTVKALNDCRPGGKALVRVVQGSLYGTFTVGSAAYFGAQILVEVLG